MAGTLSGIIQIIAGAAAIATGAVVAGLSFGLAAPLAGLLISAGAGEVLSGIGTLVTGNHQTGFATATRNPIAPWRITYGECRIGGTLVYMTTWGTNLQMLDLCFVLSAVPIAGVTYLWFDTQRVSIDTSKVAYSLGGNNPAQSHSTVGGTSFNPPQQTVNITSIVRSNDVVTVTLSANIPYLMSGDRVRIQDSGGGSQLQNATLTGIWQVSEIISQTSGSIVFTFLNGGPAISISGHGQCATQWVQYGANVYFEILNGTQTLGETFTGAVVGTPWQGSGSLVSPQNPGKAGNSPGNSSGVPSQWTNFCSLQGKACALVRLTYNSKYFVSGMPLISFLTNGKTDIYDPRTNSPVTGFDPNACLYSQNASLCIADFLSQGYPRALQWSSTTAYSSGAVVTYGNALYVACATGTNQEPDISPNYWGPVTTNNPPAWSSGTTYALGAIVAYGPGGLPYSNIEYISTANGNTGNVPSTYTHWNTVYNVPLWSSGTSYGIGSSYSAGPIVLYGNAIWRTTIDANIGNQPNLTYVTVSGDNAPTTQVWIPWSNFATLPVQWGYSAQYAINQAGSPPNIIDVVALEASASVCDQAVSLVGGGTEPMYQCNGQFELSLRRGEILQNLLTSCAGRLTFVAGAYAIQPGYWVGVGSPPWQVNLTSIAAGPFKWKPIVSVRDLYNGVKGTYISPDNKWQSTDFPYYAQDSLHGYNGPPQYQGDINLAQDGGQRRWFDMHLPFTTSFSMAQRIAKIELLRRRNYGTGTFVLNLAGYQFVPLDVFEAVVPYLGWTTVDPYIVEVAAVRFRAEKVAVEGGGKDSEVTILSIEIDVQQTNSDIYAWSTTEELSPQGYQQTVLPVASAKEAVCYPWSPGAVAPLAGDAIYPEGATGPATFSMQISYAPDAGGNVTPSLLIQGYPPINQLDTEVGAPYLTAVGSITGGNLAAGNYALALTAFDSGSATYQNTPYLDIAVVNIASGTSGSIAASIVWGSGDDGGDLYLADQSLFSTPEYTTLVNLGQQLAQNVFHYQQTLSSSTTTASITSFNQSTPGGIDTLFDHFEIVWQQEIHSGPWAQQVQAVTSTTVTIGGSGMTLNEWAGYTLSLLAYYDPTVPVIVLNMPIASNTASSGSPEEFILTIGPNSDSVQLPNLTTLLNVGDLVTVRSQFTFTSNSMLDVNIANGYYTSGATGVEVGHVAVVLSGADIGDVQVISAVTNASGGGGPFTPLNPAVRFVLSGSWQVTPSTGDLVVICAASLAKPFDTPSLMTPNKTTGLANLSGLNVQNLANQTWLFTVRTCDIAGNHPPDFVNPKRDLFVFGGAGTLTVNAGSAGYPTVYIPTWYSLIVVTCTTSNITVIMPYVALTLNEQFTVMKADSTSYQVIVQLQSGDTFGDGSSTRTLNTQGSSVFVKANG